MRKRSLVSALLLALCLPLGGVLVVYDASVAFVPEPAMMALLGTGFIGTGLFMRRRWG